MALLVITNTIKSSIFRNRFVFSLSNHSSRVILPSCGIFLFPSSIISGLYNKAVASEEIDEVTLDAINSAQSHPISRLRSSSLHMLSYRASQQDDLDDLTPIELDIKYYVQFTPFYKPGYAIHVGLREACDADPPLSSSAGPGVSSAGKSSFLRSALHAQSARLSVAFAHPGGGFGAASRRSGASAQSERGFLGPI